MTDTPRRPPVPPRATYRVQLRPDWGFDEAAELVDYLAELGVSHLYASPVLQSAPGSTHGYDVVDPTRVDEELGGTAGRDRLVAALREAGLGLVQDVVPNHVALVTPHNRWWWDVLRHGRDSAFAAHFDIDWEARGGRVLVPVLGAPLAEELERGTLRVDRAPDDLDGPVLRYHEHVLPLAEGTDLDAGLRDVLGAQHYELAHWRRASTELNYRRFFDITTLGGLRIEDPEVFDDSHRLLLSWLADGSADGLRIDHPDGLWDPTGYLEDLRAAAPDAWIVVEKILEPGEQRRPWPVDGTVGYGFCNEVLRLLVDADAEEELTRSYRQLTGEATDWHAVVAEGKRGAVEQLLGAEVRRLARLLGRVAAAQGVVVAGHRLRAAVVEALVAFPVYRTYVRAEQRLVDEPDVTLVEEAVAAAVAQRPDLDDVLGLLGRALLLEVHDPAAEELAMRFQQVSGPAMAKGVEDTAFYRYLRFVALNEVGGDPSRFGLDPARFHAANLGRQREWPTSMLLTSTHDTKRSEDVRARLAVLSEVPAAWDETLRGWFTRNARHRRPAGPSRNLEHLCYQTLVGAWPITADRLCDYLVKAAREEKRDTDWHDPDEVYEQALTGFARDLLDDRGFVAEVERFVDRIRDAGWVNSLVQTTCKLTAPGVPDVYQGCELWDLSLVDPDNRRPVDFGLRRSLLATAGEAAPGELWERRDEGLPKLALVRTLLHLRRDQPDAMGVDAAYAPLQVEGPRSDNAVAFARGTRVAVVVPRLTLRLGDGFGAWDWGQTHVDLPAGPWRDVVTGAQHPGGATPVADLLTTLPVAVLTRSELA